MKLHLVGPGQCDIGADLPAGSSSYDLTTAPSGHLLLPCTEYKNVRETVEQSLSLLTKPVGKSIPPPPNYAAPDITAIQSNPQQSTAVAGSKCEHVLATVHVYPSAKYKDAAQVDTSMSHRSVVNVVSSRMFREACRDRDTETHSPLHWHRLSDVLSNMRKDISYLQHMPLIVEVPPQTSPRFADKLLSIVRPVVTSRQRVLIVCLSLIHI